MSLTDFNFDLLLLFEFRWRPLDVQSSSYCCKREAVKGRIVKHNHVTNIASTRNNSKYLQNSLLSISFSGGGQAFPWIAEVVILWFQEFPAFCSEGNPCWIHPSSSKAFVLLTSPSCSSSPWLYSGGGQALLILEGLYVVLATTCSTSLAGTHSWALTLGTVSLGFSSSSGNSHLTLVVSEGTGTITVGLVSTLSLYSGISILVGW